MTATRNYSGIESKAAAIYTAQFVLFGNCRRDMLRVCPVSAHKVLSSRPLQTPWEPCERETLITYFSKCVHTWRRDVRHIKRQKAHAKETTSNSYYYFCTYKWNKYFEHPAQYAAKSLRKRSKDSGSGSPQFWIISNGAGIPVLLQCECSDVCKNHHYFLAPPSFYKLFLPSVMF